LADKLVYTSRRVAQPYVDVPLGVYPATVARPPAVKTGQHLSFLAQNTDARRGAINASLTDIEDPFAVNGDVHRPLDVSPQVNELTVQVKELNAVVLPVTHVDFVVYNYQAVGQVELARDVHTRCRSGRHAGPTSGWACRPGCT